MARVAEDLWPRCGGRSSTRTRLRSGQPSVPRQPFPSDIEVERRKRQHEALPCEEARRADLGAGGQRAGERSRRCKRRSMRCSRPPCRTRTKVTATATRQRQPIASQQTPPPQQQVASGVPRGPREHSNPAPRLRCETSGPRGARPFQQRPNEGRLEPDLREQHGDSPARGLPGARIRPAPLPVTGPQLVGAALRSSSSALAMLRGPSASCRSSFTFC